MPSALRLVSGLLSSYGTQLYAHFETDVCGIRRNVDAAAPSNCFSPILSRLASL